MIPCSFLWALYLKTRIDQRRWRETVGQASLHIEEGTNISQNIYVSYFFARVVEAESVNECNFTAVGFRIVGRKLSRVCLRILRMSNDNVFIFVRSLMNWCPKS